jgi:signal transduction histidine kinase
VGHVNDALMPALGERIGGRWALAIHKWLITFFLLPLLAAGYTKNIGDPRSVVFWMLFALIGLALVGCTDMILDRTLFRNRRHTPVPAWWVAANSAWGGLLIGTCAWIGGSFGGVHDSAQMAIRIPSLVLLGGMWGVLLTLLLEYRERATKLRGDHIDQMVQLELMKAQQSVIVEDVIRAVRNETDQEIGRIRELVQNLDVFTASGASAVLRSSARDAIGPLSRQLWASAKDSYPKVGLWSVVKHSVHSQPFRPWDLAILTVCLSLVDRVSRIGIQRGVIVTSVIVVIVVVELSGANSAMRRCENNRSRIFLGSIVIVEIQTILVVIWERQMMSEPVSFPEIVVSVLASLFLIFLTVGLRSLDLLRGEVARFAIESVEGKRIESITRDRQISAAVREMARDLHGSVQTRLISCALALEIAAEAGDSESGNAALLEARRILEPHVDGGKDAAMTIEGEVARKIDVWKMLCNCTTLIDVHAHSSECANRVGRVVEEGITNAVRHGEASVVAIDIRQDSSGVRVRLVDNGLGPTLGSPGLGSAILDQATGGNWSLAAGSSGAVLTAVVPNN